MLDEPSTLASRSLSKQRYPSHELNEDQPLLSHTNDNQRYDGAYNDEEVENNEDNNLGKSGKSSIKSFQWLTLISIIVTISITIAILLIVFIAPTYVEEYAKEAVSIEPSILSIDSFTPTGVMARVQADFSVNASRVPNKYVRNFGRLSTWIAKKVGSDRSTVKVLLPDYDDLFICVVTIPRIVVDIRDKKTTPLDILIEIAMEDMNGVQMVANKWLQGGIDRVRMTVKTEVTLDSGIIRLAARSISKLMVFEGENLPRIPRYDVSKLNFNEISAPAHGNNGLAIDSSIIIDYDQIVEFDMPALGFEILVQGCNSEHSIRLISINTKATHIYPNSSPLLELRGIITSLPDSLRETCPGSSLSPLETLIANFIHGNQTSVLIRGSNSSSQNIPKWLSGLLSKINVPLKVPGHEYNGLVRDLTISDTKLSLPDLFAEPDSDAASPKLSGHLEAATDIPEGVNFNMSVSRVRAAVNVLHKGAKFGELDLHKWQKADCELVRNPDSTGAFLKIQSDVNNAPLKITDDDIFADIIGLLLFKKKTVIFKLEALVDVLVSTVLGEFLVKDLPAETTVPIKL